MRILALVLLFRFAAPNVIYAQTANQPTLPQATVNLTMPTQGTLTCPTLTTGSNCIRNVPAGSAANLQSAINAATCGDTIVLTAGSTYSGNFTIPSTSCSGWIEIISSNLSGLRSPGNRIRPSDASNMAIISTPNTSEAIRFLPNSNHWRLIGLEITTSDVTTSAVIYYLVSAGLTAAGTNATAQSQLPTSIIIDRSYIVGLSNTNTEHGINLDAAYFGIVDSYCAEIHAVGYDSQCFFASNGAGPYLIQNNFIEAAGENIMFGGADPAIPNLVPSDITIVGNLFQKNPVWEGEAAPYNWTVKNLFELKNAQRVLVDGNIFQNTWAAAQDEAMILRSVNQSGACTWCVVQNITVTHNIIQHAPMGIVLDAYQGPNLCLPTGNVLIQNNVLTDINSVTQGPQGWMFEMGTESALIMHDIIIDHNTTFSDVAAMYLGDIGTDNNIQFTNNIMDYGKYGVLGNAVGSGTVALTTFLTNYIYNDIVFISSTGHPTGTYPNGTLWNTEGGVGFTSVSGTDPDLSGNFQLASSSPYYRAGTDGKDIGVWDWACLNEDSAAALAGQFAPGLNGCASSGTGTLLQPPTNLRAVVQ